MTHKSGAVAARSAPFAGRQFDARYLCFFDCFNRQRFHEAHDVLEDLWLERRRAAPGAFFRGLIQLAGAFVLLQKGRLRPAHVVFERALSSLREYPPVYESADLAAVRALIDWWCEALARSGFVVNPLDHRPPPVLAMPGEALGGKRQAASPGRVSDLGAGKL